VGFVGFVGFAGGVRLNGERFKVIVAEKRVEVILKFEE
jgi:hypothetical protein